MTTRSTDVLVIGSGIAGLFYALHCSSFARVLVVTKSGIGESNTMYAQGGIAAVTHARDSIEQHVQDTLTAGAGHCNEAAVRLVAENAATCIAELERMSVRFDRDPSGHYDLHREGGHSQSRVLHAADATGREVENSLVRYLRTQPNIEVLEHHFVVDLMHNSTSCTGACVLDVDQGQTLTINANLVMLASGGGSQVFLHNTNPSVSTGDGYALAARCGATLEDMEFVQFHPTSLASKAEQTFLISEAVRGFGAVLCHADGHRFMERYHPMASLAPRDVVSRAISMEMNARGTQCVYLDLRGLDLHTFQEHFPNISKRCTEEGLDLHHDLLPVVPAAHYFCGGVKTDLHARTSVDRLYACGEVACTGVHGANRLASNSLLEGLVFAVQAAHEAKNRLAHEVDLNSHSNDVLCTDLLLRTDGAQRASELRQQVQVLMWSNAGILRRRDELLDCAQRLGEMKQELEQELKTLGVSVPLLEVRNMMDVGIAIADAAAKRAESLGCHWIVSDNAAAMPRE